MAFVVIGAGAAGLAAATRLRELGREVTLISREVRAYSLCSLPYLLSGEVEEARIFTGDERMLREMGIAPLLGRRAREVDPKRKAVRLDDGTELRYDGLLLATGSVPFAPPPLAADIPGLCYFNSLDDTRRLMERARTARSAVVIGAGFTGLECAYALRRRGLDVTVVEMEDRVLPRILDRDMFPPVEELLAGNGVGLRLRSKVLGLDNGGGRVTVRLEGPGGAAEALPADLAVMCLGVRPDLALARSAGVRTGRGILVGPDMQTSVPGIYAAGDVAEFEGQIPATWLTAAIQGGVAASNLAGREARFSHLDQVNIATLFGVPVVGIGAPATYQKGPCEQRLWKRGNVWRKLVSSGGRTTGFQSVGDLNFRGLASLLSKELAPLQESFARAGLHHPALFCAPVFGMRPVSGGKRTHIRKGM
ncbi:MAG: NAD(P)/FAD-dependent oxidoreductase [Euryarchaeota archaeon]|nr:NAD(P)/FAD-dependent oxidoreductase [Euryarchaeota archaeon]